jgi:hypothetical protein
VLAREAGDSELPKFRESHSCGHPTQTRREASRKGIGITGASKRSVKQTRSSRSSHLSRGASASGWDRVITENGAKFADAMKTSEDAPYSLEHCMTILADTYCDANEVMLEALVARGHAPEDVADWHGFAGAVFERAWVMKYYRDDGA